MSSVIPNFQDIHLLDAAGRRVKVVAWYVFDTSTINPMVWDENKNVASRFNPYETYTKELPVVVNVTPRRWPEV